MKPEIVTAAVVAALVGLSALARRPLAPPVFRAAGPSSSAERRLALCPAGTLPDQGVCIPVPRARPEARSEAAIPKRADRPADYGAYRLPVAASGSPAVVSTEAAGSDGGVRGLGISIAAAAGTPVTAMALDGQDGPSEIVFAGSLIGGTVIIRSTVRTSGRTGNYLSVIGNLDEPRGLAPKTELQDGAEIGKSGPEPLYFEIRLVRAGVDPFAVPADRLLDDSQTVSVDVRNLLRRRRAEP